jgi:CubicO group peptidase (beta-lactamase class C family)
MTGGGLSLRSRDLFKFAQLYLNGGTWNGAPVLSADWIKASVSPHANVREDTDYGYLWWLQTFHSGGRDWRSWGMYGTGGNKVVVFPDQQVVVVVTTTNYRVPGAAALSDKIIVDYILQAEQSETSSGSTTSGVFPITLHGKETERKTVSDAVLIGDVSRLPVVSHLINPLT